MAAAKTQLWRAAKITTSNWEITDYETNAGQWSVGSSEDFTYNMAGHVTSRSSENYKEVYEYDAEGRIICETVSEFNGVSFAPAYKYEYGYDGIVKDLVVSEKFSNYDNDKWILNEESRLAITRNADNNITKIVDQESSQYYETPGWHDEAFVEIAYGADKKATSIRLYEYEDHQPYLAVELVDIVWERTDGQIVFMEMDEADFFLGANRMQSAMGPKANNYPYAGDIYYTVTYKPNDGGFVMNATMNGSKYMSQDYTVLDTYGSFTSEEFEIDYDYTDDDICVPDGAQLDVYTEIYDAYGLKLKDSEISYIDGDKANGISDQYETTGTVTYDSTYGYPLEYISKRSYNGQTPQNDERIVFSDYYDVIAAGVTDVVTDENAPVEYYNLRGVRVENPANGIYIRRQGNSAAKVIIR